MTPTAAKLAAHPPARETVTLDYLRQRIADLEEMVGQIAVQATRIRSPFGRLFLARRGGPEADGEEEAADLDPGMWRELTAIGAGVTDFEDGRRCEADEDETRAVDAPSGSMLLMEFEQPGAADEPGHVRYVNALAGFLFAVNLSQTGGEVGGKTTQSTWTYTVTSLDGQVVLGEEISPAKVRPNGRILAATQGVAYWDLDELILWDTDERFGTGACS